jgi:hypothetical protein
MDLLSDAESDCYDKLALLNGKFQGLDGKAKPQIYKVFGRQLQARGIENVVFSRLDSQEDDSSDMIAASLEFKEHNPPVIKRETQVNQGKADEAKAPAQVKLQESEPTTLVDMNEGTVSDLSASVWG